VLYIFAMAKILLLILAGMSTVAAFLPVSHHSGIGAARLRTSAWAGQQHAQNLGGRRSACVSGAGARGLCAQIKFADAVEEVLKRKFKGKEKVPRVLKSWRRCAALPHPHPILGPLPVHAASSSPSAASRPHPHKTSMKTSLPSIRHLAVEHAIFPPYILSDYALSLSLSLSLSTVQDGRGLYPSREDPRV
jgi:hypothetical protein